MTSPWLEDMALDLLRVVHGYAVPRGQHAGGEAEGEEGLYGDEVDVLEEGDERWQHEYAGGAAEEEEEAEPPATPETTKNGGGKNGKQNGKKNGKH